MRKIIDFVSEFDGSARKAVLLGPDGVGDQNLPLIIVPHAAGFSAEATAAYWRDLPAKRNVLAVFPYGHSRNVDLFSLGWRGQIADLAALPSLLLKLGYPVDTSRVYSVGISMGGTEGLLLAGRCPGLLSGVVAFNPLIDLNSWSSQNDEVIPIMIDEIGGTSAQLPNEYRERSPISYAPTIARLPVLLFFDPADDMVQFQSEKQSGLLYRMIKASLDAPIEERLHHFGHYWIRPAIALDWLLNGSWAR